MSIDNDTIAQPIIDKMFQDKPHLFVEHHLTSYNDFFKTGMKRIMKEKNPIRILKEQDEKTKDFKYRCNLYLGGKNGDRVYLGKPVISDDNNPHYMFPNEARLRNMTYAVSVHYDVEVDFFIAGEEPIQLDEKDRKTPEEEIPTKTIVLEKIYMGRFPIMLKSDLCILSGLDSKVAFEMGECKNDHGGYFIIDGKEKCVVPQEKFADNMLYVREKVNELYGAAADIRCAAEDTSKPVRTLSVRMVLPSSTYSNNQIVVVIPNVRKPIPLFILMRALGVESDKDIIEHCLLDLEKNKTYIDLFIPSVHDANLFFTQDTALKFIATFTKGKTIPHALEILTDYLLPNIGEMNFKDKAYFIGYMVFELLKVHKKIKKTTDRDSFRYKRVELTGSLLSDLFKEYYSLQMKNIFKKIDKEYYYKEGIYQENFYNLIELNVKEFFAERVVDTGIRKAFKGNWGAEAHTKRLGVVQDLNRLSYNSALAQLRKVNLSIDASAKITGPLLLHSSQWGMIDPVDTPDGGNVGLHKHMSMAAHITSGFSSQPIILWLRKKANMSLLTEATPYYISSMCKVMVNGSWVGCVEKPSEIEQKIKLYRRVGLLPIYMSVFWNIIENTLFIYTDGGRLTRPIYYIDEGRPSYARQNILDLILANKFTWHKLLNGFSNKRASGKEELNKSQVYDSVSELYGTSSITSLKETMSVIEYIDNAESEGALIAMHQNKLGSKPFTHIEIHPSLILGVMGNQVVFPENNQLPRDLFACGQMKQAVSLYHSNYQNRIDKMGVVLNTGQIPLVKSRYLNKISKEEHPYGVNVVVAIMCYGGYNVEDAILFNGGSLDRGIFRTTYYNMYESYEESSKVANTTIDSKFANIENENVIGLKPGFDYGDLDQYGLVKENTILDDKKVLIGKMTTNLDDPDSPLDASVFPKKGQLGYVDKSFITDNDEGFRIAKVRVRHERVPAIGDKFCSRCGQKGTIGLVIPEANMPFTDDGIRPDIIVNPHALPSRMTIGQLVETLMGKACCMYGGYGDCTAFMNKGSKHAEFGEMLKMQGFHSSGNQVLYNGETGEQMESNIFIGPTYYMRLKHMVKDKINYRARGPRTALTRQTVQGRANDGGLRVGEMERDGIVGHGAAAFLKESMLVRGDEYYLAICNVSGMIAIYNDAHNLFLSPQADGPIQFKNNIENNMQVENISKYGRSFSILRVPYAFKLLMQELQSMNIQMRIITDDNIDQLANMSYSNNMFELSGKGTSTGKIVSKVPKKETKNPPDILFKTPEIGAQESAIGAQESAIGAQESAIGAITLDQTLQENKDIYKPELGGWYKITEGNWGSLILNVDGRETDTWDEASIGRPPDDYPNGWDTSEAVYKSGNKIPNGLIVRELRKNVVPNNWSIVIKKLIDEGEKLPVMTQPLMTQSVMQTPDMQQTIMQPVRQTPGMQSAVMQPGMQSAVMQSGMQPAVMQPGMQSPVMQPGMQSAVMQPGMQSPVMQPVLQTPSVMQQPALQSPAQQSPAQQSPAQQSPAQQSSVSQEEAHTKEQSMTETAEPQIVWSNEKTEDEKTEDEKKIEKALENLKEKEEPMLEVKEEKQAEKDDKEKQEEKDTTEKKNVNIKL